MGSSKKPSGISGQWGAGSKIPFFSELDRLSSILQGSGIEENINSLNTPGKRRRFVESIWDATVRSIVALPVDTSSNFKKIMLGDYGERRKQALANMFDEAVKRCKKENILGSISYLFTQEMVPIVPYTEMDYGYEIRMGAAIWILEKLRKNGNLEKAQAILPFCPEGRGDWYMAFDFCYPTLDKDQIKSVIFAMETRYPEDEGIDTQGNVNNQRPSKKYQELMGLLNPEDIEKACNTFKKKQWELIMKIFRIGDYNEREIKRINELMRFRPDYFQTTTFNYENALYRFEDMAHILTSRKNSDLLQSFDNSDEKDKINLLCNKTMMYLDRYLQMDKKRLRRETNRELVEIISGFQIEDPYELCFALLYLLDYGDDAPWIMSPGTLLMRTVRSLLPWYENYGEMDEEDYDSYDEYLVDDWFNEIPYDRKGWTKREAPQDPFDYIHEKHRGRTLAQIIFHMCHGVVPMGMHPFETDREELIKEGMEEEKARKLTDIAELLFLLSHKESTDVAEEDEALLFEEMEKWIKESISMVWEEGEPKKEGRHVSRREEPRETTEKGESEGEGEKDELEKLKQELESAKKQIKGLTLALNSEKHTAREEKARFEKELGDLRREHRELADLRTLVFNQENEVLETRREKYAYPYETRKRTVVFGGHDTFIKAIKTLLPGVKYVSRTNLAFQPDIVKNAEVVWVQTNCMSHSQYFSIVKYCKIAGVQLRYFGFASAEKCADQLVTEDKR